MSADQIELRAQVEQLSAQLVALTERVDRLEAELRDRDSAEVSEDVMLAISAAVAAYLGHRATVKQVHLRRGGGWATQGRSAIQQSHAVGAARR